MCCCVCEVAVVGALVCGLSLCNQHTVVLYVVVLVAWVLFRMHRLQVTLTLTCTAGN